MSSTKHTPPKTTKQNHNIASTPHHVTCCFHPIEEQIAHVFEGFVFVGCCHSLIFIVVCLIV